MRLLLVLQAIKLWMRVLLLLSERVLLWLGGTAEGGEEIVQCRGCGAVGRGVSTELPTSD